MIQDIMVIPCDECKGAGFLYFGNGKEYHVEQCDCNMNDDLLLDWIK
jgi:hypothetical protein